MEEPPPAAAPGWPLRWWLVVITRPQRTSPYCANCLRLVVASGGLLLLCPQEKASLRKMRTRLLNEEGGSTLMAGRMTTALDPGRNQTPSSWIWAISVSLFSATIPSKLPPPQHGHSPRHGEQERQRSDPGNLPPGRCHNDPWSPSSVAILWSVLLFDVTAIPW